MVSIGIVVIGRNEGVRLTRCLESLCTLHQSKTTIIYVDSCSSDDSVERAKALGVNSIELDTSIPLTAARGRNAGFYYLMQISPELEYVQFIDGDCELVPAWTDKALAEMKKDQTLAVVWGRRRESSPEVSVYNRLLDMEWNIPIGYTNVCGGDSFVRVEAIQSVAGFNNSLICGEEPEMCIRLRHKGWKILHIDADMTLHDGAMYKFSQWWKRAVRGGWAVAEGKAMHGDTSENYMVRQHLSGWFWGLLFPLAVIGVAIPTKGIGLLLLACYPLLITRIYNHRQALGDSSSNALAYSFFCVLSKFPQMLGQLKYWLTRWRGKQPKLIEYKVPSGNVLD
jgi:glycosyltransferase involved in cell wall biosynthesis